MPYYVLSASSNAIFRGTPGVTLEPVFGGIDHPRFSIRGSGLQRGTQPAGRGIELRFDGLPMTYGDTSFDFVEWIDPLLFDDVVVLRGGRGALEGAAALGGVVDFNDRSGEGPTSGLLRAETGSFDYRRGQAAISGGGDSNGFASLTYFEQDGFRQHNQQEAARGYGRVESALSQSIIAHASLLWSDSELELPGPQTLAQIDAGSDAAQPDNIIGDWRRFSERIRVATGFAYQREGQQLDINLGYMQTDVEFRRRDVQVEDNQDWSLAARYRQALAFGQRDAEWGANLIYQHNDRQQSQFFNGGGTPPTFSGAKGSQWADNDLQASRLTLQGVFDVDLTHQLQLNLAAGWDIHERDLDDNFTTRPARPAAELDGDYDGFNGLAFMTYNVAADFALFAGVSHLIEPPTYDVLLINVAGTPGPANALLNGDDPRRPITRDLDEQSATTVEIGGRGQLGPVALDLTLYRIWLENEIVSTTDAVTQNVTSVGNADDTLRWGVEAAANIDVAQDLIRTGDLLRLGLDWTWTEAQFDDDDTFGNNQLPIVVEHLIESRLGYRLQDFLVEAFVTHVPDGGYADYANTLQADGYTTLGARISYDTGNFIVFAEGRNITDEEYASTVIGARNNLNGQDNAIFAPGEPAAFTIGLQANFE
jgi:iron complex outermembrane receptor protein